MLTITQEAAEAISALADAPGAGGIRISAGGRSPNGHGPSLQVELALAPDPQDQVIHLDGAELFVDPAAVAALEDKVLDAEFEGDHLRFAVIDPS